jgi:MFS family permease
MSYFLSVSIVGFAATAVTYGPARIGFGLFLGEFRTIFGLTTATAGIISSLGFFGFLLGLLATGPIVRHYGPRLPVLIGAIAAAAGAGLVALASGVFTLAVGIFLAMSSAGFSWAPFNKAVQNAVELPWRPVALSAISSGTSIGVILAGLAAFCVVVISLPWRWTWGAFACVSAMIALWSFLALRPFAGTGNAEPRLPIAHITGSQARLLLLIGASFGATTAVYISFAADRIASHDGFAGVPSGTASAIVFIIYGLFGFMGLATDRARRALGQTRLMGLLFLASALSLFLIAFFPASTLAVVVSASLQGVFVMMMSAVLAFRSERVFAFSPSQGFNTVLIAVAVGGIICPLIAGFAMDRLGGVATFAATAGLSLATLAVLPAIERVDRSSTNGHLPVG